MIKKISIIFIMFSVMVFAKEVTVSISAQKYFVEKIAKEKVAVNVMVKPGFSPATYEPKVSQMRKLSSSEAYFSIGVPFESVWLEKFKHANEKILLVDTSSGIEKIEMEEHEHHEDEEDAHHEKESHEEDAHHEEKHEEHAHHENEDKHEENEEHEKHEHGGLDPHIWLDPILVKVQAKNIYLALVKIDIKNKEFYRKNYESFLNELDSLDNKLKTILKPYKHKAFMVFHPSWGYFAKRYDLEQIAIEVQGKEPKPAQLVELVEEAKKHNIKIVFVSPQFSQNGAKTISKSINGNVAIINPLAEKWDENLIKVAKEIAKTYK